MYLPTADGGRAITDALTETFNVVNIGRALAGQAPLAPKGGARFHFDLRGAVLGFQPERSVETRGTLTVENARGHSARGQHSLALRYRGLAPGRVARAATPTFVPPEATNIGHYTLLASPTLYPGQTVRARLEADAANAAPIACRLYLRSYGADDKLERTLGPETTLAPGAAHDFSWHIPDMGGQPIAEIGVELSAPQRADGSVYLDELTWDGQPDVVLRRPDGGGTMWRRAWVDGVDQYGHWWPEAYRLVQNRGTGLLIQGAREWTNYCVSAAVTPHLVASGGIGARVQGMRRYYGLLLKHGGTIQLVKALDGERVLAEASYAWEFGETHTLALEVAGTRLRAWANQRLVFEVEDRDRPLEGGAVALICAEGRIATDAVEVRPIQ
jgi:hypothetical protein